MAEAGGGEEKGLPTGPTCAADERKCAVSEAARPADNPVDDIYEAARAQGMCVICLHRARDGYGASVRSVVSAWMQKRQGRRDMF